VQIGYLGPLEVRDDHGLVDVPGRRLRTLLGRLAVDVGRPVPPRALIEALWPDEPPLDPANALQSLVSRARRALGDPTLVEQLAGGYRLNVAADDVDAVRFARLASKGRAQIAAGAPALAAETLAEALALWRGEPLPDDETLEAEAVRARLADLRMQVQADRIEADLAGPLDPAGPELAAIITDLDQLIARHPLREDLAGLHMRALVAAGRPAQALAAYETTRVYLADALGSDPSAALQEQHLAVLRLQDGGAPTRQTNLRVALTSFVGRDDDASKVNKLLGAGRLVTIVGSGGAGKTRLASEVAASWVGRVRDGVWFIELAPVSDPGNIAIAVLDGLGIRDVPSLDALDRAERPLREARERVLLTLADAECLVVIDNCEHVIDAAAGLVAEVLGTCPSVRVIATSREPLGIDGETLHPLTPLGLPARDALPLEVAGAPAVRLLLDRAAAVGADLSLDEATVADVVEVVRRLDGLPLAIELAAARLRVLSIGEVATRLADRFRLLTGGRRTAVPRHRTLRAVVEWSWDLLTPLEREVADHFSVFGSGATAEAVAAVCPSPMADGELEDLLHALVDKSLLVPGQDLGESRFRMLETLREFGTERLREHGTLEAARAAHAAYFAELVRTADVELRSDRQVGWLHRLDTERDNALTALAYLGEHDQPAAAIEMAVAMTWGWMLRENGKDTARWLKFALDLPGAQEAPLYVVAEALHVFSAFATPGDDNSHDDGADEVERRATLIALADRLEPVENLHSMIPLLRPLLLFFAEEIERATVLAERNLTHDDLWMRAATRTIRAAFRENEGDTEGMRADVELGLAEWEQVGDHWGLAALLSARGHLRTLDGDHEGAAADFEQAQYHQRALGGSSEDLMLNMRLADLRLREGDFEGARRVAEAIRCEGGTDRFGFGHELFRDITLGAIALGQGDEETLAAARVRVLEGIEQVPEPSLWHSHPIAIAYGFLGAVAARLNEVEAASRYVREGMWHGYRTKDLPIIATVGVAVAGYAHAIGADRDAAVILGASARLRGSDDRAAPAIVALRAELSARLGDELEALYARGRALSRDEALARLDPALLD
jgi:predicted ATPase/DNA-binding SARP family transcriptional activator